MKNLKHTHGEWKIDLSPISMYKGIYCDEKWIAHIAKHDDNLEMSEANAKLIAAAPELLESLIEMVRELDPVKKYQEDIIDRAKQIIKKAT